MENYKKGGYEKRYQIRKIVHLIDGQVRTKATDPNADYFVLRLDKDPHALKALMTYAESVRKDNPAFANDLLNKLEDYGVKATHQEVEGWISVEDRLPESGKCILLYSNSGGIGEGSYSKDNEVFTQWRWCAVVLDVTHWMPLPTPPKDLTDKD